MGTVISLFAAVNSAQSVGAERLVVAGLRECVRGGVGGLCYSHTECAAAGRLDLVLSVCVHTRVLRVPADHRLVRSLCDQLLYETGT